MNPLQTLRPRVLMAAACFSFLALPLAAFSQDLTPPVVRNPLADFTVETGTPSSVIKLKKTFGLNGVTGQLVRVSTTAGNLDLEIFTQQTPKTAAAFLGYAEAAGDNTSGTYSYTNTLLQRVYSGFDNVGGSTIIQGGGFYVDGNKAIDQILGRPAIPGEAGIKNTRGTVAMALSTGPDSATGDFFFNVGDNPGLDDGTYGGPFTVFGRVVGSAATLDAIAALPRLDFSSQLGGAFTNVPLVNYDGSQQPTVENFVYTNKISAISLVPPSAGAEGVLSLKVKNSNPGLLTATITGKKLKLAYTPGKTGTARLKVFATDSAGNRAKSKFVVTVQ